MLVAGTRVELAGGPAVQVSGNGPMALEACGGLLCGTGVGGLSPSASTAATCSANCSTLEMTIPSSRAASLDGGFQKSTTLLGRLA